MNYAEMFQIVHKTLPFFEQIFDKQFLYLLLELSVETVLNISVLQCCVYSSLVTNIVRNFAIALCIFGNALPCIFNFQKRNLTLFCFEIKYSTC